MPAAGVAFAEADNDVDVWGSALPNPTKRAPVCRAGFTDVVEEDELFCCTPTLTKRAPDCRAGLDEVVVELSEGIGSADEVEERVAAARTFAVAVLGAGPSTLSASPKP